MKMLFAVLLLSSGALAAPDLPKTPTPSKAKIQDLQSKGSVKNRSTEPSAVPCLPQETRSEKLDDLAKLEGRGESHSTNCPAQGAIKEPPTR